MKSYNYLILLCCLLLSCGENDKHEIQIGKTQGKQIMLSGKIKKPQPEKAIYVYAYGTQDRKLIDSLRTDAEGNFNIRFEANSPTLYGLNVYGQHVALLASDADFSLEMAGEPNGEFVFKGSQDNKYYQEFLALQAYGLAKNDEIQQRFMELNPSIEGLAEMQEATRNFSEDFRSRAKSLIEKMDGAYPSLYVATMLSPQEDGEYLNKVLEDLESKYPNAQDVQLFRSEMDRINRLNIGSVAPNFELPQINEGGALKLSDLRGKYVLVDFWASWCGPCRKENPNVKKVYEKYANKNFEILGVSTDAKPQAWKQAVEADQLPWLHVLDQQGEASSLYNVNAIPFTILLDPEGKIIAKNLHGAQLESTLAQIL